MEPRVFVEIQGGLGNQMFQYAAGRALSLRLGLPLTLDLSWYQRSDRRLPRSYSLSPFSLSAEVMTQDQLAGLRRNQFEWRFGLVPLSEIVAEVRDPRTPYWPGFSEITGPVHLRGYWQSPHYFKGIGKTIRADFAFPSSKVAAAGIGRDIQAENSVAVHVRRGDYVSDPFASGRHGGCCPPEYYARALDEMAKRRGRLKLFLFSDDAAWLKSNFDARGHQAVVVDIPEHANAPHHDLHLMSLARHHIIANSTFSWWGAWLAHRPDQVVIAPSRWNNFSTAATAFGTQDRVLESWIRL